MADLVKQMMKQAAQGQKGRSPAGKSTTVGRTPGTSFGAGEKGSGTNVQKTELGSFVSKRKGK